MAPTRLKGAQSARAMWATRGLTEAPAQRARQEGTRCQRDQPHAAHASQARIQEPSGHRHASVVLLSPSLLKGAQSARAMRATRGLTGATAQRAIQGSTRARLAPAAVRTALLKPIRLLRALRTLRAPATRAGRGLMEEHARRAAQASTRMYRELSTAAAARQTRAHLIRAQL